MQASNRKIAQEVYNSIQLNVNSQTAWFGQKNMRFKLIEIVAVIRERGHSVEEIRPISAIKEK